MCMENNPNNADAPVTKADLKAEFGKFEEKMEKLLSEQANVILEAVGETMEKKLDEKFDPVITKLDGIMKGVEALQQENTVGAEQLRRHEDQLQKGDQGPRQRDHCRIRLASVLILRTLRKANHRVPEKTRASTAQDDGIAAPSNSSRKDRD